MPEYPRLNAKEAEKLLFAKGFELLRQKGSHKIYAKGSLRQILPHHSGEILHPKIVKQVFEMLTKA